MYILLMDSILQELASVINLSTFSGFSLFECRNIVQGSNSIDLFKGIISEMTTSAYPPTLTTKVIPLDLLLSSKICFSDFSYLCLLWYTEEFIRLDEKKYVGDILAEFKSKKDRSKGEIFCFKLVFKRRLFKESDKDVSDPIVLHLSYIQVCCLGAFWYLPL